MQPDITEPRPAPGERDRYKSTQAVSLKQDVLATFANSSKESLGTDVSVDVSSAPGFAGVAIVFHGLRPWLVTLDPLRVRFQRLYEFLI